VFPLIGGLCCVGFMKQIGVTADVRRQRPKWISSIWGQKLNRSLRNVMFLLTDKVLDNIQNCVSYKHGMMHLMEIAAYTCNIH
jgi:hypothetical protein